MDDLILLTDGSINARSKNGYGAALTLSSGERGQTLESFKTRIQIKRFEQTSSTKLELQTLLWALSELPDNVQQLTVYTDSQNIITLSDRRKGFEAHDYHSKRGIPLRNTELYRAYFAELDRLQFKLVKIAGHQPARKRNAMEQLFALVDKAARKAQREEQ